MLRASRFVEDFCGFRRKVLSWSSNMPTRESASLLTAVQ
jgi:hypothetical protein